MTVFDSWYPWKLGKVTRTTRSSVYVTWVDGKTERYDLPHAKRFLREYKK